MLSYLNKLQNPLLDAEDFDFDCWKTADFVIKEKQRKSHENKL